jgi:hypothetical protein
VKASPRKSGAAAQKNKTPTKAMTTPKLSKASEVIMSDEEDSKPSLSPAPQTPRKRAHNEVQYFDGEESPTKTVKCEVKEEQ